MEKIINKALLGVLFLGFFLFGAITVQALVLTVKANVAASRMIEALKADEK